MKRFLFSGLVVFIALVPFTLFAQDKYEKGVKSITERELTYYVRTLASDRYEGRLSGTKDCDRAAKFIESELKRMKLSLVPDTKSHLWEFEIKMPPRVENGTKLAIKAGVKKKGFRVKRRVSAHAVFPDKSTEGDVVFAGYGITAPEYEYDDYAGIDVKNKVVIVMRREPQKNLTASKFKGKEFTKHARLSEKVLNAQKHGAVAVIIVTDPVDLDRTKSEYRGLRTGQVEGIKIPVVFAKVNFSDWVFKYGPKALEYIQKEIDKDCKPRSFAFEKMTAEVGVELKHSSEKTSNVMALCKGSDPDLADEYIVIGAHYDHIGHGLFGLQGYGPRLAICNGADDNASGTAVVMEVAEAFGLLRKKPKRSVIFVLFSGEERGLLGSKAFVENPPVPLEKVALMINLDMVGRYRGTLNISGVGTADKFSDIVTTANRETGLTLKLHENVGSGSDHLPFYQEQIPVIYFATGLHKDYHKPTDDWDKINYEDMLKTARLCFNVAAAVADLRQRPEYTEARHPADKVAYLGLEAQDVPEPGTGALVKKVIPGSPAEKAGFREGDIVLEFGGRVIHSADGLRGTLYESKQGKEIKVMIIRNEEELEIKVKLGRRKDF